MHPSASTMPTMRDTVNAPARVRYQNGGGSDSEPTPADSE